MDNNMSPPLAHSHSALGVVELLENILLHVGPADILYNAQAVSKFWNACIQGSVAVKKRCFLVADHLSKEETERRLFLGAGLPDYGKSLIAKWSEYEDLEDIAELTKVTPTTLRAFLAEDPFDRRYQYKVGIQDYFEKLDDEEEPKLSLMANMGHQSRSYLDDNECDARIYESLLDMSRVNPLLRRSWKGKGSAVFTGYENHVFFALGDNYPDADEYFTYIREFLEVIAHALSTEQSRQIWQTVQITSPAVTKLTIGLWLPAGSDGDDILFRNSGITMLHFANLFIATVRVAVRGYDTTDLENWMGRLHNHKQGDRTWRKLTRSYKKERNLIDGLLGRPKSMDGTL